MLVCSLEVDNFRNLQHISLQCSPNLNLLVGENASGKTSILEALYFLGRARSFRTHRMEDLIHTGASAFRIMATMTETVGCRLIPLGIQRSSREVSARIDGAPVRSLVQLALQVPVLLLSPSSHRLLEDGPQQRRRFIDWGLFHSESAFMVAWKRYGVALRHRNATLRANAANRVVDAWDEELALAAATLDCFRESFCEALQQVLRPLTTALLGMVAPAVDYRRGWAQGREQDLAALLRASRDQDRRYGYTRLGPHRADFSVRLNGSMAQEYLSRGQQKLLVIALVLAQARLYQAHHGSPCILLIDDLPAELDCAHRDRVMQCLAAMETQLFITAIEANSLDTAAWPGACIVNLKHGIIS
jgi:DNA replication and repair protein RecF